MIPPSRAAISPFKPALNIQPGFTIAAWVNGNFVPYAPNAAPPFNVLVRNSSRYALAVEGQHLVSLLYTDRIWKTRGASFLASNAWRFVAVTYDSNDVGAPATLEAMTGMRADRAANPIIPIGDPNSWDPVLRELGNIVFDPNEPDPARRFKTWYTGYRAPYVNSQVFVGYCYSPDGWAWTKAGKAHERPLEDPYVVLHDGVYYMFAEDKYDFPPRNIRRLHSLDGEEWIDDGDTFDFIPGANWESTDVSSPIVWIEDGQWIMLYEGRGNGSSGLIGLARSSDGFNWVRDPNNPIFRKGPPGSWDETNVVPDDITILGDRYWLSYHGGNSTYDRRVVQTGFASSTDLYNWTRHPANPTGFNASEVVMPAFVPDPNGEPQLVFHIYESARGICRYFPWQVQTPKLFVDGVEDAYWGRDDVGNLPIAASAWPLAFGRDSTSPSNYYRGAIDEVYLFNRALSPVEIEELYLETASPQPAAGPFDPAAFGLLCTAIRGPGVAVAASSFPVDYDLDVDVDLRDLAVLQTNYNAFPP